MNSNATTTLRTVKRPARTEDEPRYVVGIDAHSKVLAISVWDWSDRLNAAPCGDFRSVPLSAMAKTYARNIDPDSITLIEASTNSAAIKRELNELGFRAEIVRSDTIAGKEKLRKVCDMQDARNLARAYIKGDVKEFVWTPSDKYANYRDIAFAYRDACKDLKRLSNRIWNMCSQNRLALPPSSSVAKVKHVRSLVAGIGKEGFVGIRLGMMADDYERLMKRREELDRIMAGIVIGDMGMLRLMQQPGISHKAAFVTWAAVEDPRRFETAAKLAAYGGLSPTLDTSGDEEARAAKRGGSGKPLDHDGRRDLKFFYVEAGNAVMNLCSKTALGKWGWRRFNSGKPKLKVLCAVGHKLLTYAWHIMLEHPTPNRDSEAMFLRKLARLCRTVGDDRLKSLGYATRKDFYRKMWECIYSHLPVQPESESASS